MDRYELNALSNEQLPHAPAKAETYEYACGTKNGEKTFFGRERK